MVWGLAFRFGGMALRTLFSGAAVAGAGAVAGTQIDADNDGVPLALDWILPNEAFDGEGNIAEKAINFITSLATSPVGLAAILGVLGYLFAGGITGGLSFAFAGFALSSAVQFFTGNNNPTQEETLEADQLA